MPSLRRAVFDCNTLLQAVASPRGPAGECVQQAFDHQIELFISSTVINELRDVAARLKVARKLRLTADVVDIFIHAIESCATRLEGVPELFTYSRDPDDAHYINLALAADAALIVSHDRDLLDLMDSSLADSRDFQTRFPHLRILTPVTFLRLARPQ